MSQLCTLEQLKNSGFGHPFPRHGLQLLFWFANHCVTCQLTDSVFIMKLVSHCQPESGFYGFHPFGNIEELLPVLDRPRKRNKKKQVAYFEVGNLNTETYPASADLPTYVRENYGSDSSRGKYNIDRIIISYQVRSRVVETLYVTRHDGASSGRFSPDKTYEISPELIQALRCHQLELTAFLTKMGYYRGIPLLQANQGEEIEYQAIYTQQVFNTIQYYSGSTTAITQQQSGNVLMSPKAVSRDLHVNVRPFGYDDQKPSHYVNVTQHNSRQQQAFDSKAMQHEYRRPNTTKRRRAFQPSYWPIGWEKSFEGFDDEAKKRTPGGGLSLMKIVLGVGALCLAAKCFSWLRSCRTPNYQHTHVMLDYVY